MNKSTFFIEKMDCPAEEQLVRMRLEGHSIIKSLDFDLSKRELNVFHTGAPDEILTALQSLNLNSSHVRSIESDLPVTKIGDDRKLLWIVLMINLCFFFLELLTGLISRSMGLIADSLDMLADALVYGMALFAAGGPIIMKIRVAKFAGYFQIILAALGVIEVIRRFMDEESLPNFQTMIMVSALALIGNVICLHLLQKGKNNEVHMKASMIFTSNDIIINASVIIAGLLVNWLNSGYPDLIIGAIVFIVVVRGAFRILKLASVTKDGPGPLSVE